MSHKEEAVQAKEEAEKKMQNEEFGAARRLLLKAQRLYPSLEKLSQMLLVCDVHCTAEERLFGNEIDWYGILQIEYTADEEAIKKQYRKLALQLHPDKNKFSGAETAFKLITEARTRLTCHVCKNKFIAVDIGQATASTNTHHSQPAPCQQQKDVPNWAVSTTAGTKFEENASSKKCEAENLQKTTNVSRPSSGKVNNKRRRTQVCKSYEDDVAEYGNLNTTKDFGCFGVYPRRSTQLKKKVSYNEPVSDDDEVGSSPKRAKVKHSVEEGSAQALKHFEEWLPGKNRETKKLSVEETMREDCSMEVILEADNDSLDSDIEKVMSSFERICISS